MSVLSELGVIGQCCSRPAGHLRVICRAAPQHVLAAAEVDLSFMTPSQMPAGLPEREELRMSDVDPGSAFGPLATSDVAADTADRFGFQPGMVVMEIGDDDDVDEALQDALAELVHLVDEDFGEWAEAALVWYRDGDGDLVDTLMEAR